jgi:hypothetical protein
VGESHHYFIRKVKKTVVLTFNKTGAACISKREASSQVFCPAKAIGSLLSIMVGRDSSVGIVTSYRFRSDDRMGERLSAPVQTGPGAHPASCVGTGAFPVVKRPGRGVDHPPHIAPRLKEE